MGKVDMNFVNFKLNYGGNTNSNSNKNLSSDMLSELANALNTDLSLLKEDFNNVKRYSVDESDIILIGEMMEKAKSKEGKRVRCKDYSVKNAKCISFFRECFRTLHEHNNVPAEIIQFEQYKIMQQTNFIELVNEIMDISMIYNEDLEKQYFVPNDAIPDVDDRLTASDKFVFLKFIKKFIGESADEIKAVYWFFMEERKAKENDEFLSELHAMNDEEKRNEVMDAFSFLNFENSLNENSKYINLVKEWTFIEGGSAKLKNKKGRKKIEENIVEILKRSAELYLKANQEVEYDCNHKKFNFT